MTGKGGEELTIGRSTVRPIHPATVNLREVTAAFNQALQQAAPRPTPEQAAEQAAIRARTNSDPRVIAEGTIAYLVRSTTAFASCTATAAVW